MYRDHWLSSCRAPGVWGGRLGVWQALPVPSSRPPRGRRCHARSRTGPTGLQVWAEARWGHTAGGWGPRLARSRCSTWHLKSSARWLGGSPDARVLGERPSAPGVCSTDGEPGGEQWCAQGHRVRSHPGPRRCPFCSPGPGSTRRPAGWGALWATSASRALFTKRTLSFLLWKVNPSLGGCRENASVKALVFAALAGGQRVRGAGGRAPAAGSPQWGHPACHRVTCPRARKAGVAPTTEEPGRADSVLGPGQEARGECVCVSVCTCACVFACVLRVCVCAHVCARVHVGPCYFLLH